MIGSAIDQICSWLTLLVNVTIHITPPGWTKAGPYRPGSLLHKLRQRCASEFFGYNRQLTTNN